MLLCKLGEFFKMSRTIYRLLYLTLELRPSCKIIDLKHFEQWIFRAEQTRAQFLILNFRTEQSRAEERSSIRKFRAISSINIEINFLAKLCIF